MRKKRQEPEELDYSILSINESALDEEWRRQPKLMGHHTKELADARREQREAEAELKRVYAEISLSIRNDPEGYELPKVTEDVVEQTVLLQEEYQEAQRKSIEARHRADLLQGMVSSLDDRKKAIEGQVTLFGMDYFSIPKRPDPKAALEIEGRSSKRRLRDRQKKKESK